MVVCRFYLQGNCRYGDRCRFEHPYNDYKEEEVRSSTPHRQWNRANENTSTPTSQYKWQSDRKSAVDQQFFSDKEIIQSVNTDMDEWLNSQQWHFSVYAPTKEAENFPEFVDISPEEMRWEAYSQMRLDAGSLDQYRLKYAQLHNDISFKCKSLMKPTIEILSILRKLFHREKLKTADANSYSASGLETDMTSGNQSLKSFQFKLPATGATASPNTNIAFSSNNFFNAPNSGMNAETANGTHNVKNWIESSDTAQNTTHAQFNAPAFSFKLENNPRINENTNDSPQTMFGQRNNTSFSSFTTTSNDNFKPIEISTAEKVVKADMLYSIVSELTDDEKLQFESSMFSLGKIPQKPPPKQYCKRLL